jgi:hypothetical protein
MHNILIIFGFSFSLNLFFSSVQNIKVNFDPNHLRLTSKPENITNFFQSLIKTENFDMLTRILRTEASDFIVPYCNTWKSAENSQLINKIWLGYYQGRLNKEMMKEILLPECVAKSYSAILSLSRRQIVDSLPHSLLQVRDFPFQLLIFSVLKYITKKAIYTKPHDPKIKWSSWIVSEELEFNQCPESSIYYKFGWQLINPQEFHNISDMKAECLIKWLLLKNDSDFLNVSDEEALMRTLTLVSWDSSYNVNSNFYCLISRKINQRSLESESDCIILTKAILILGGQNDPEWNLNLLFRVMAFLRSKTIIVIGDWFIGILSLWRNILLQLTAAVEDLDFIEKILNFALFTLEPTFQGVTRLPELFHPSIRPFVEKQVYERFKHEIKSFYREYPTFFENCFDLIPLNIRITSFLRKKRVFSTSQGRFLLNAVFDMETFIWKGSKDFLLFLGDKLRNGIDLLSKTSLNPALYSFAGELISFKRLTSLFLQSVSEISEWFHIKNIDGTNFLIPTPFFPDLFWELLGYFLIQARILNLKIHLVIEKEFFLEMMDPIGSVKYIQSLSEQFKEQNMNEFRISSSNSMKRFTVASVIDLNSNTDGDLIDCRSLAFQLFSKGMKSMREGINHVLEPAKFSPEELYNFLFVINYKS